MSENYKATGRTLMNLRICSICFQETTSDRSCRGVELGEPLQSIIRVNIPRWNPHNFVCFDCAQRFNYAQGELSGYLAKASLDGLRILPTPVRLGASPRYTGRGVTMVFLDSGFYLHPDLMRPEPRIL